MKRKFRLALGVILIITALIPLAAAAAVVGRVTMVEGHVDLLKQGNLPAIPVKVQDGVETGDVIRTKARSKAQITFVDDTALTLAPESRVAVADYIYDPNRSQRRATLRVFRGMVHTVVNRILQLQEPDFIMQTATGTLGVRGTEWYTLMKPNSTLVYLTRGGLALETVNPSKLLLDPMSWVEMFNNRFSLPRGITPADIDMLRKLMDTGVPQSPDFQLSPLPPLGKTGPGYQLPEDLEKGIPLYVPPILTPGGGKTPGTGGGITPGPGTTTGK
jgi:hypothetical protein